MLQKILLSSKTLKIQSIKQQPTMTNTSQNELEAECVKSNHPPNNAEEKYSTWVGNGGNGNGFTSSLNLSSQDSYTRKKEPQPNNVSELIEKPLPLSPTTRERLKCLIDQNVYLNTKPNRRRLDRHSLSSLIDRPLTHPQSIRLGIGLERVLIDIIIAYRPSFINIKEKNKKGELEKDHLFKDEDAKKIHYAEIKGNIYLDTEKRKATILKMQTIVKELEEKYPDYQIQWCLVGCRYISNNKIPPSLKKNYKTRWIEMGSHLFGINDYFNRLGMSLQFTEESWKECLNVVANKL